MRRALFTFFLLGAAACGSPPVMETDSGPPPVEDAGPQCLSDDDCSGALVCADGLCQR